MDNVKVAEKKITEAVNLLKEQWNKGSISEMQAVMDYARLLNITDYVRTITE